MLTFFPQDSVENFPKYTETTPLRGRGGRRGRDRTDRMVNTEQILYYTQQLNVNLY